MREVLDLIPYFDIIILGLLAFFLYVGWNGGVPKILMVTGAVYTGFLLASIYYHLLAVWLSGILGAAVTVSTDLVAFLGLDVLVTVFMLALLLAVFGHVEVKGRLAAFDKLGGTVLGFFTGFLVIGILMALLRVPYESNKTKLNTTVQMPIIQLFNNAYARSALAPSFMRAAPYLIGSVTPMLPPETRARGAVPLLEMLVAQK